MVHRERLHYAGTFAFSILVYPGWFTLHSLFSARIIYKANGLTNFTSNQVLHSGHEEARQYCSTAMFLQVDDMSGNSSE